MYEVYVESDDFRGKNTLAQHRLVNKVSNNNGEPVFHNQGIVNQK